MIKRALAAFLAVASVVSLTACNPGQGTGDTSSREAPPEREMVKTDSGFDIPKMELTNKTLKYLGTEFPQFRAPDERTGSAGEGIVYDYFNKYYGGVIECEIATASDMYTTLATKVLSGDSPDIVNAHGGFPSLVSANNIQPVDNILNFDMEFLKPYKEPYEQFVLDGKHYYLPWVCDVMSLIFYNTDIIKNAGLEAPRDLYLKGEWTWSKFKEYAQKLTVDQDKNGKPERYGVAMTTWHDASLLYTTGKKPIKLDGTTPVSNLADSDISAAFNFLADLTLKDKVADSNRTVDNTLNLFKNGNAAMLLAPDYYTGDTLGEMRNQNKLSWAPLPKYDSADKHYVQGEAIGFYVPEGAQNIDGVEAFMYAAIVAMKEGSVKGTPIYEETKKKTLEKYPGITSEQYDADAEFTDKYNNELNFVIYPYEDIFAPSVMYELMLGVNDGAAATYQQATEIMEPQIKEKVEALMPVE